MMVGISASRVSREDQSSYLHGGVQREGGAHRRVKRTSRFTHLRLQRGTGFGVSPAQPSRGLLGTMCLLSLCGSRTSDVTSCAIPVPGTGISVTVQVHPSLLSISQRPPSRTAVQVLPLQLPGPFHQPSWSPRSCPSPRTYGSWYSSLTPSAIFLEVCVSVPAPVMGVVPPMAGVPPGMGAAVVGVCGSKGRNDRKRKQSQMSRPVSVSIRVRYAGADMRCRVFSRMVNASQGASVTKVNACRVSRQRAGRVVLHR